MSLPFRIAAAASLAAVAASPAVGQTAAAAPPAAVASAAAASTAAPPGPWRSAFADYRRFADQPVGFWREANDTVGRIGGGQAHAREDRGAAADAGKALPATAPAGHAGHRAP